MSTKNISFLLALLCSFFISISTCHAKGNWADQIDAACDEPVADCNSCHSSSAAQAAFFAGGTTLTDYFCPTLCEDADNDGYHDASCGGEDCNDNNDTVNPGADEICGDGLDNTCDGVVDEGCCSDDDGDGFLDASCGGEDCNDNNDTVNPGADEICGDGLDNTCDGVVDEGCCTDGDNDTFAVEGGECGPVDCNDNDYAINPGEEENCTDTIDNDCDGSIDAADGNAVGCPPECTDNDDDGYAIEGDDCGPVDCDDSNGTVNPGADELCGDELDNTCDGVVDEGCVVEPTCTDNDGDTFATEGGDCGPADCNDSDDTAYPAGVIKLSQDFGRPFAHGLDASVAGLLFSAACGQFCTVFASFFCNIICRYIRKGCRRIPSVQDSGIQQDNAVTCVLDP